MQLLYVSRPAEQLTHAEVQQIVSASRRQNWHSGLTGCLLFTGSAFAQVLEGPVATVQTLFERLRGDARHTDVRILWSEAAGARRFANWTMGYVVDVDLDSEVVSLLHASTGSDDAVRRLIRRMADDVFLGTS